MQVSETVLVFAGIPLAIIAVIAGLSYATGSRRGPGRYRPGRPYEFAPVWFVAAPERLAAAGHASADHAREVAGTAGRPALTAGATQESSGTRPQRGFAAAAQGATGGASDRW